MIHDEVDTLTRLFHATTNEAQQGRIKDKIDVLAPAAHRAESAKPIGWMTALVRDEPGVLTRPDQWDANPRLLACPGATIELTDEGHSVRPPRRADRLTRLTVGRPGTGGKSADWQQFLRTAQPNSEVRLYVQKLLGYGLVAGNPRRLLVIFLGKTSTGKTTIGEIINHVLGDYAGPFNLSLFRGKMDEGPRSDVIKALGRRMIFASEVSQRWQLHADEVKRLTGGDSVQARDLYTKANATVERRPAFLPVLSANHVPTIEGADPATRRRLLAVPFDQQIDPNHEDPELGERIRTQETDAVLDWVLHGYDMYCKFGLGEPPHAVVQATRELHDSLTVQDHWLTQHTLKDAGHEVTSRELWGAFMAWCKESGIPDDKRGSQIGFGRHLSDLGYTPATVGKQRGWRGLKLGQPDFADHGS
jgi:P4 family phage/plasmid primase-like protien